MRKRIELLVVVVMAVVVVMDHQSPETRGPHSLRNDALQPL